MKKLDPKVYILAAELIANRHREFSCTAIMRAASRLNKKSDRHVIAFEDMFKPEDAKINHPWFCKDPERYAWADPKADERERKHRVIALLLMSELVKKGDL